MLNIMIVGGAGASGRHLAAGLQAAGHQVTIVDPSVQGLKAIKDGLRVVYPDSSFDRVSFSEAQLLTPRELQEQKAKTACDLVICVTKAFDLNSNLAEMICLATPATAPILLLCNGLMPYALREEKAEANPKQPNLGQGLWQIVPATSPSTRLFSMLDPDAFADYLATSKRELIGGVLNYPATKNAEGVKVAVSRQRVQEVGLTIGHSASAAVVSEIFKSTQIGCKIKESAAEVVFGKIGDLLSIGPQALFDTTFIEAANPASLTGQITEKLLGEYHAIASSLKVNLGEVSEFVKAMQEVMRKKGESKGSMHPDLTGGRLTEKAAIYGALVELACLYRLPAPTIAKTFALLDAVEDENIKLTTLREYSLNQSSVDDFYKIEWLTQTDENSASVALMEP